jgi:hypothetical protein
MKGYNSFDTRKLRCENEKKEKKKKERKDITPSKLQT